MSSWSHDTLIHFARRVALLCAALVVAIGATTLAGTVLGFGGMSRLAPHAIGMVPNMAVVLTLFGVALAAHIRPPRCAPLALAARLTGPVATLLIGVLALQWVLNADFGLDQLLVRSSAQSAHGGRPGPLGCGGLLMLGLGLELDRRRAIDGRLINAIVCVPTLLGVLSVTGYLSGVTSFTALGGALRIAPGTALALIAGGISLLLSRPQRGMIRLLVSSGPGGLLARRLLPVALVLPLLLDGVRLEVEHLGLIDPRVGDWAFTFLILVALAAIVLRLARGLDLLDVGRRAAEERLRHSEELARSVTETAHDGIVGADADGLITLFNPAAEALFGWAAAEVLGRPVTVLMPERYRAGHEAGLARVAAGADMALGPSAVELHGLTKAGREFDLEISLALVRRGPAMGVTAIMRDISPRKLLEALARQESERMALVVAAQSAIAGGTGDLAGTMHLVAQQACAIVGGDGAVVELPDGDDMVYRAAVGTAERHLGARVAIAGSLAGTALTSGETLSCVDTETDPRVDREACRRIGVRSMLCVPLRHDGGSIGVLKVASGKTHRFGERDERALELLAGLVAATVHRAQVERRLAAHHAASEALAGARSLEAGLAGALRGLVEQLGWGLGAVWLAEGRDGSLACAETWHHSALRAGPYLELCGTPQTAADGGLVATVRRTSAPAWLEDAGIDPASSVDPRRATAAAACGLRTIAAVPIISRGETLGVVELGCPLGRTHDGATLDLITDIAAQIGQFVQRRRAEERMATQASNLAAVAELSHTLSHTPNPGDTRPTLCRSIQDLARADEVALLEPDGAGNLVITAEGGGLLPLGLSLSFEVDEAVALEVFRSRSGRFVGDIATEARHCRALQRTSDLRSGHYEPLVREGEVIGVLFVGTRELRAKDAGGIDALMRLLAAEAASALAFSDLMAALDKRARTDQLTGVPNRRTWDHELPRELSRATRTGAPVSLAILDLDHFKTYNDTHGHPAGDRLLRVAAAAWSERLRTTDVLARYGGEEFAVLLPACDETSAAKVTEQLRAAVPGDSTCSIGVVTWDGAETADELVARADAALYRAKDAGRDRVVVA
jgi:diguanylate cyclase (GGDEF)-like protein/PAS domain S-box-containing protein